MKYLIVGDVQAKKENLGKVRQLLDIVEHQEHNVVWLGDLLDRRGHIEAEVLNLFYDYFSHSRHQHNVIVGNHDLLGVHSEVTALQPLKALENVAIIDEPHYLRGDGPISSILMVPYYRNPQKFLAAINDPSNEPKPMTLICHQGVKEFTIGSGYTEDDAVAMEDLAQFDLVIAGHYHTPKGCGNITYLGSPFSHSFGESNEEKRIGILDTATNTLEYIRTDFPRHLTFERTLPLKEPIEVRYYGDEQTKTTLDYYRFIISGNDKDLKTFRGEVAPIFPVVKFIYKSLGGEAAIIGENMTNADKWIKWAKEIKKLDQDTINVGLELLK